MDPFSMAQLAMTGASLFGGLFGGSDQVDTSPYKKQLNRLNNQASQMFDTKSGYYKNIAAQGKRSLLDLYYNGMREQKKQLASQGINSNSLSGVLNENAISKTGSGLEGFMSNMYQQGAAVGANLYGQAGSVLESLQRAQQSNANTNASWRDSLMTIGTNYFTNADQNAGGFNGMVNGLLGLTAQQGSTNPGSNSSGSWMGFPYAFPK